MIFGIGTDVVKIERVAAVYERFGRHFVERLLLPEERAVFDADQRPARFLAMRFAAKEAIVKALGTGFGHGVWIRDVGFLANAWGRPEVRFSPRGRAVANQLGAGDGHVSLTDEAGLVVAVAILMRKS
ncbi:MAG TPA: holo-ACP synthase [Steroidobacteraceae bacterium]|nr:holo-ACP synthase [Steroidobacteraceae bacterium]